MESFVDNVFVYKVPTSQSTFHKALVSLKDPPLTDTYDNNVDPFHPSSSESRDLESYYILQRRLAQRSSRSCTTNMKEDGRPSDSYNLFSIIADGIQSTIKWTIFFMEYFTSLCFAVMSCSSWISVYLLDGILASRLILRVQRLADVLITPCFIAYALVWYLAVLRRAIPDPETLESGAEDTLYVLVEDFKRFSMYRQSLT
jgi:hypothetical protein